LSEAGLPSVRDNPLVRQISNINIRCAASGSAEEVSCVYLDGNQLEIALQVPLAAKQNGWGEKIAAAVSAKLTPSKTITTEDTASHSVDLRVLTYNLFIRPPFVYSNKTDYKDERLHHFASTELHRFDLICLQELFARFSGRQKRLVQLAEQHGIRHSALLPGPPFLSTQLVDGGVTVLSKHAIVKSDNLLFSRAILADRLASKGVLYCAVQVLPSHDGLLHVFNTHLQSEDEGRDVRKHQLQEAATFIRKKMAEHPSHHYLLMGDLNVDGNSLIEDVVDGEEYLEMVEILKTPSHETVDLLREACGTHPPTVNDVVVQDITTLKPTDRPKRLDYIFLHRPQQTTSSGQRMKVSTTQTKVEKFAVDNQPYANLSDHYGISTVLTCVLE